MSAGPRNLRPCGTRAAYRRHKRNGEKPCAACRAVESRAAGVAAKARRARYPQQSGPKPPGLDPVVPYRYRARTYPWAVRVLEYAESVHGRPEDEEAA